MAENGEQHKKAESTLAESTLPKHKNHAKARSKRSKCGSRAILLTPGEAKAFQGQLGAVGATQRPFPGQLVATTHSFEM